MQKVTNYNTQEQIYNHCISVLPKITNDIGQGIIDARVFTGYNINTFNFNNTTGVVEIGFGDPIPSTQTGKISIFDIFLRTNLTEYIIDICYLKIKTEGIFNISEYNNNIGSVVYLYGFNESVFNTQYKVIAFENPYIILEPFDQQAFLGLSNPTGSPYMEVYFWNGFNGLQNAILSSDRLTLTYTTDLLPEGWTVYFNNGIVAFCDGVLVGLDIPQQISKTYASIYPRVDVVAQSRDPKSQISEVATSGNIGYRSYSQSAVFKYILGFVIPATALSHNTALFNTLTADALSSLYINIISQISSLQIDFDSDYNIFKQSSYIAVENFNIEPEGSNIHFTVGLVVPFQYQIGSNLYHSKQYGYKLNKMTVTNATINKEINLTIE